MRRPNCSKKTTVVSTVILFFVIAIPGVLLLPFPNAAYGDYIASASATIDWSTFQITTSPGVSLTSAYGYQTTTWAETEGTIIKFARANDWTSNLSSQLADITPGITANASAQALGSTSILASSVVSLASGASPNPPPGSLTPETGGIIWRDGGFTVQGTGVVTVSVEATVTTFTSFPNTLSSPYAYASLVLYNMTAREDAGDDSLKAGEEPVNGISTLVAPNTSETVDLTASYTLTRGAVSFLLETETLAQCEPPVPEPSTMLLLISALIGIEGWRYGRRSLS